LTKPAYGVNTVNVTQTREQILTQARELFLAGGLNGFSMRQLAQRVGVTATALYRHFEDKDAVLASVLGEAFATFGSYLGRALGGRTPLERFRLMGEGYIDFALEHPRDYELMFLTNCSELGFKAIRRENDARSQGTFEFLVERVQECVSDGSFPDLPARQLALYAWSSMHGVVSLWLLGQVSDALDRKALRAQALFTLEQTLRALGAPAASGPTAGSGSHRSAQHRQPTS
jgi:AcrR family transcriptional regulator